MLAFVDIVVVVIVAVERVLYRQSRWVVEQSCSVFVVALNLFLVGGALTFVDIVVVVVVVTTTLLLFSNTLQAESLGGGTKLLWRRLPSGSQIEMILSAPTNRSFLYVFVKINGPPTGNVYIYGLNQRLLCISFIILQILIGFQTCTVFLSNFVIAREKIQTGMITVQYSAGWFLEMLNCPHLYSLMLNIQLAGSWLETLRLHVILPGGIFKSSRFFVVWN